MGSVAPVLHAQPVAQDSTVLEPGSPTHEQLERRGFFRRRATGTGWYTTYAEPVFAYRHRLSEMLRAAPGVNVVQRGGGAHVFTNRDARGCPLAVFVDGAYTTIRNVDELDLEAVAAVEVYRSTSEVPIAFHAPTYDRTCGALLVWSRLEAD